MVRYLHPADHIPRRVRNDDNLFGDELDFEGIKFTVKIKYIPKIKKRTLSALVLLVIIQSIYPIYVSKNASKKNMLLLIEEEGKNTMFLSKILIHLCMIIQYIVEENICVIIVYKLLVQKK